LIEKPLPQTSRFFPGRRGDYRLGWQCAGIPDRLRDHHDLLILGPVCGYSDTWQLTINMGTLIITFLMVFLIQKTQNRDTRAVRLKMG